MHLKQIQSSRNIHGDNLLFRKVYRSPMSSEENTGTLNSVIGKMHNPAPGTFSHICVVGDFNFPWIWWSATRYHSSSGYIY